MSAKHEHWRVTVEASGEHIVSIEPEMLAGREPSGADEEAIRTAARCLLAFVENPMEDAEVDPALIAAAPELLEALKECVALLRLQKGNNLHDDEILHVSELAIAKAEARA